MRRRAAGVTVSAVMGLLLIAAPASATQFANPTPVNSQAFLNNAGPVLPYPSPVNVTGMEGTITSAKVTLNSLSYSNFNELDILVVDPAGRRVIVMSQACGGFTGPATLVLDDAAPALLPNPGSCPSGSYKPTNRFNNENFLHPVPPGPYPNTFSSLNGGAPNGVWLLYANDTVIANGGSIAGGWALDLETTGPTVKKCKKRKGKKAAAAKKKNCKRGNKK